MGAASIEAAPHAPVVHTPATPRSRSEVDGVLLLDKDAGPSSHTMLRAAARLLGTRKAGHTGTLDPLASGLLPICLGEATKFAGAGLGADKAYRATVHLGIATSTGDAEGEVVLRRAPEEIAAKLPAVLAALTGEIEQTPPRYSAVKVRGRPLYEYARAGVEVQAGARRVAVRGMRLIQISEPLVELELSVSKGTYIRGLAEEIGRQLGCGAHLAALRRIRIGSIGVQDAVSLDRLQALPEEERRAQVRAVDFLLQDLPRIELAPRDAQALRHGQTLEIGTELRGPVRLYAGERFVGLGDARAGGWLAAKRLMAETKGGRATGGPERSAEA